MCSKNLLEYRIGSRRKGGFKTDCDGNDFKLKGLGYFGKSKIGTWTVVRNG